MAKRIFRTHLTTGVLFLCLALQAHAVSGNVSINLEYKDEPLADVLQRVSALSGFTIVLEGQLAGTPVSGKIDHLPLDEALRTILKQFNSTIVWDEKNGKIMISVYSSSLKEGAGQSIQTNRRDRDPTQANPEMIFPSNGRNERGVSPPSQPDRHGTTISGEGVRFIQGTRTTGP